MVPPVDQHFFGNLPGAAVDQFPHDAAGDNAGEVLVGLYVGARPGDESKQTEDVAAVGVLVHQVP